MADIALAMEGKDTLGGTAAAAHLDVVVCCVLFGPKFVLHCAPLIAVQTVKPLPLPSKKKVVQTTLCTTCVHKTTPIGGPHVRFPTNFSESKNTWPEFHIILS